MFFVTQSSNYILSEECGLLLNAEVEADFLEKLNARIENPDEQELSGMLRAELTLDSIYVNISTCSNLGLEVTQDCNFFCKYCSHSGLYDNHRLHSPKKMDIATAQKAVELFFQTILFRPHNKSNLIFISFYGGECLLEFGFIQAIIEFSEKLAAEKGVTQLFDLKFRVSTNGFLLTDEVVDFLSSKGIFIDVSIDGPEAEHDKYRVTREGQPTWAKIIENLTRIKQRYPAYYSSCFNFLVTIHPAHDGFAIDQFFEENIILFPIEKVRFNAINVIGLKEGKKELLAKNTGNRSELHFFDALNKLSKKFYLNFKKSRMKFTGTCFPGGHKIFVDADGNLKICERMPLGAPNIGHVDTGFNMELIRKIVTDFNQRIIENRCWDCHYWFMCCLCYATAWRKDEFVFDCTLNNGYLFLLKKYIENLEKLEYEKFPDGPPTDFPGFINYI